MERVDTGVRTEVPAGPPEGLSPDRYPLQAVKGEGQPKYLREKKNVLPGVMQRESSRSGCWPDLEIKGDDDGLEGDLGIYGWVCHWWLFSEGFYGIESQEVRLKVIEEEKE